MTDGIYTVYKRYISHSINFEENCSNLSFMVKKDQLHQSDISYIQNFPAACVERTDPVTMWLP